jgi:hypothetical protein
VSGALMMWRNFIFFFLLSYTIKAEVPVLERVVDLSFTNEPVANALDKIRQQTGAAFGYQSYILNNVAPVSGEFKHKSIREVLSAILPKNLVFKSKGNHVIIKERSKEKAGITEMSGYVYEANSDKKLANVTIYDKNTLQSVTTDEYGFYSIQMPSKNQCLTVNKQNYDDTCIALRPSTETSLTNIALEPAKDSAAWKKRMRDFSTKTNDLFKKFKGYVNTLNVKDTINQNFQFSVIPYVGTNGKMSGSVYNKYSINLIGGYSRGNRRIELGGMFNINKENMTGLQAAGMFNLVGDSVKGAQFAGFFNLTGRSVQGLQGAGFMNLNMGTLKGAQGAGFMNINKGNVYGATGAGFMNLNRKRVIGLQVAGFMNFCGDTLMGLTGAGYMNFTKFSKCAVEIAGFMNTTKRSVDNVQLAGFMNQSLEGTTKFQLAGFMNQARVVTGTQIGFINICDSIKGIPLGFISIVKSGLHQIEIFSDEVFYTNLAFRTGVNGFHNILFAGIQPSGKNLWHFGYGVESSLKFTEKVRMDIALSGQHVSKDQFYSATSELVKGYLGANIALSKKIHLAFGPTLNFYVTDALLPQYATTYNSVAPYSQYSNLTRNGFDIKGWIGGRVAIRFF